MTGIQLTLLTPGGTVEVRAAPEDATEVPAEPDAFAVVQTLADPVVSPSVTFEAPVTTRFLLVWFTELPQFEGNYKNGVANVVVLGE